MKIGYTNFKKACPAAQRNGVFNRWFYFKKFWSGKLINIGVKHHQITIDLRGDLFFEMTGKKAP